MRIGRPRTLVCASRVGGEVHVVAHTRVGHALLGAGEAGDQRPAPLPEPAFLLPGGVGAARAIPRLVGTGELRRNTASAAPSHIKIALIDFLSSVFLWVSCRHPSVPDRVPMLDFLPLSGALHEQTRRCQRVEWEERHRSGYGRATSRWSIGCGASSANAAGKRLKAEIQRFCSEHCRGVIMPRSGTRSSRGRTTARRRRRRGR